MTELLPMTDTLTARQPRMTETALELAPDLTAEEWEEIGHTLGRANRASGWWIGDWVNYGETKWGEKYDEAGRITGLTYSTLSEYAHVAKRFDSFERSKKLTFTHHARLARVLDSDKRQELLEAAEEGGWSTREIDRQITPVPTRSNISTIKRHAAFIAAADTLARIGGKWDREMTDTLTPPQANKQLTVLRKAEAAIAEVIEAVEYRAATLHTFLGR